MVLTADGRALPGVVIGVGNVPGEKHAGPDEWPQSNGGGWSSSSSGEWPQTNDMGWPSDGDDEWPQTDDDEWLVRT